MDDKYIQRLSTLSNHLNKVAYVYNAYKHLFKKFPEDEGIVMFMEEESEERWYQAEKVLKILTELKGIPEFNGIPHPVIMPIGTEVFSQLVELERDTVNLVQSMVTEVEGVPGVYPGFINAFMCTVSKEFREVEAIAKEVQENSASAFKMRVFNDQLLRLYA